VGRPYEVYFARKWESWSRISRVAKDGRLLWRRAFEETNGALTTLAVNRAEVVRRREPGFARGLVITKYSTGE
jgi:hypothetical protein